MIPQRFHSIIWAVAVLAMVAWSSASRAAWTSAEYKVVFRGVENYPALAKLLPSVSQTVKHQNNKVTSRFSLVRRTQKDIQILTQALHSQGWFEAVVDVAVNDAPPFQVEFTITTKDLYTLGEPTLKPPPRHARFKLPLWQKLGLIVGGPAESASLLKAATALATHAQEQGFAFAKVVTHQADLDRKKRRLYINYHLDLGHWVRLGPVTWVGTGLVKEDFLRHRIPWKPGTIYHPARLTEARQAIVGTGLFTAARLRLAATPNKNNLWPVIAELTERKHRTWQFGAGFSTDQSVVLKGSWEHRNFRGAGERWRTQFDVGTRSKTLETSYNKPDYPKFGQKTNFSGKVEQTEEKAYENSAFELAAGLTQSIVNQSSEISLGVTSRFSQVKELSRSTEASYETLSVPLAVKLDHSDALLDATKGWRLTAEMQPVLALVGDGATFIRWTNRGSHYYLWHDEPRLILANRLEWDFSYGAKRDDIPADQRFFAGGGGTLRGYGHQLASPLNTDGTPLGGGSLLAMGTELRYRIHGDMGGVVFVDAGRAYTSAFPDLSESLFYGAGAGLRYITAVGPIRLDVGVPLKKRDHVDDNFQIYVSIGQAF